ncbi:hypothetical protein FB451DRAFT_1366283 [Mycena latifolia]|nr:hypothetical protein FB451DRAFT_1366283 [Mycena latifolia]
MSGNAGTHGIRPSLNPSRGVPLTGERAFGTLQRKDLPRASEAPWKGPKASQGRPRPVHPSQGALEALFKFTRPRKGVPGWSALGSPPPPLEGLGALARYKGDHTSEKTHKDELLMREGNDAIKMAQLCKMSPKDLKRHAYRGRSRDKELILIARKDTLNERQAVYNKYAEIIESKRTAASASENGAEGNTYELGPCAKNPTWRGEDIDIYLRYNFEVRVRNLTEIARCAYLYHGKMKEFRKIIKGDMLTEPRSFNVKELALVAEETACAALQESLGKKHHWKRLVAFLNAILRKVTVFFGFEARVPAIGTGASPEVERARASRNRSSARLCDAGVVEERLRDSQRLRIEQEETRENRWWWWEARSEPLYMTAVTTVNTIGPKIGKESVVYVPPLERNSRRRTNRELRKDKIGRARCAAQR